MTLKLAINARFQYRRVTGVERYAYEISSRLRSPKRFLLPQKNLGPIKGHLWEQFVLPRQLETDELLWSPANTGAWGVANQVLTIHDASVFDHPEWFKPQFATWTRLSWTILARKLKAVITVSEFSKQRLKYHLGIAHKKIHVIHNGVGDQFKPQPETNVQTIKEKYGIQKPYFLFVGTLEPRKNLSTLLQAWKNSNFSQHELFISGVQGTVFENISQHVTNAVYVPDEDLPALYSGAAAFVYPSLYEGFGLPVLEAMACGTPVITSNSTVFPEIFEKAALLVDPKNPNEISDAMKKIIEDQPYGDGLREQGLKKAEEFSWEASARKTQVVLESVS